MIFIQTKNSIGKKIKHLRKLKGFTQQQLAQGICTQALISMFEKDESVPSSLVLFKISERLNCDVNYFFDQNILSVQFYLKENNIFSTIRQLILMDEIETANEMINHLLSKEHELTNYEKSFFYLNKGNFEWNQFKNKENAIYYLSEALKVSDRDPELSASIYNSKAIVYLENEQVDFAIENYLKALSFLENNFYQRSNIEREVLFGLTQSYIEANNFHSAAQYCEKGIDAAIKNDSTYLLGDLLSYKGKINHHLGNYEISLIAYNQAKSFYQLKCDNENEKICEEIIGSILTTISS